MSYNIDKRATKGYNFCRVASSRPSSVFSREPIFPSDSFSAEEPVCCWFISESLSEFIFSEEAAFGSCSLTGEDNSFKGGDSGSHTQKL